MNITVSGKNMDVGESLSKTIEQELRDVMARCVGDFIDAHVSMKKVHGIFECEIDVHISRGFFIRSNGRNEDPYTCATQAMNTLKQRTKKYKARLLRGRTHKEHAESVSNCILEDYREEEVVQEHPVIVAEMPDTLETLAVGDAVMRLDLSSSPVLIFKNISSGHINVLYRRPDGNLGWVAPKDM
ncbi:MAG: ribosome-associated translation inhibitor RaiA [Holosporales bacterium]|nr:ribosome-associated translation inhibitor RaiA [Holosporales bacterium]